MGCRPREDAEMTKVRPVQQVAGWLCISAAVGVLAFVAYGFAGPPGPCRAGRIVVRTMVSDHLGRSLPWCCARDGLRLDTAWGHHGQDWVVRPVRGGWTPRSRDLVGSPTAYGQGPNEA